MASKVKTPLFRGPELGWSQTGSKLVTSWTWAEPAFLVHSHSKLIPKPPIYTHPTDATLSGTLKCNA
eukprot:3135671-Prymnesium_polylepis.1